MKTITAVAAKKLGKFLAKDFREIFGSIKTTKPNSWAHSPERHRMHRQERCALSHIRTHHARIHGWPRHLARTDARAHRPEDYIHLIVACLLHDIGFVRGVLSGDTKTEFVIDKNGQTVTLPRGASDASLAAYHVDRSKLFVYERLGKSTTIDAARVAAAIELTRFPPTPTSKSDQIGLEPRLVQAADLIGQLGDPLYPRKANALFYEFEELGSNRQFG